MKKNLTSRQISLMGIMLGIQIAISYLPSIKAGAFVEVGFGFIGTALSGALFGPFYALILASLSDLITALLHGKAFFIGFTLSAGLAGYLYGKGLWRQPKDFKRVLITVLAVTLIVNLGLNSIWVKMITGKAWAAFMSLRIIKNVFSFFINTGILYVIFNHPTVKKSIQHHQL